MSNPEEDLITNFCEFSQKVDYSLMDKLVPDPDSTVDGKDYWPRQVFSGHYVPVAPKPIKDPEFLLHSKTLFHELGLSADLIFDEKFKNLFSGNLEANLSPLKKVGWATGYALSIYGTEYNSQCPFRTGNGYGDGRAISVFEGVFKGKRWEMQLKGGGPTPYCRGADGRAVLRSSVREFLAQEHMHALGVPTSRSLTLFVSHAETVVRPWYSENSKSFDPDILVNNPVAICTRVAPSFIRVGQLELFSRRVKNRAYPNARNELEKILRHLIEREYKDQVDQNVSFESQLVSLAFHFRERLTDLLANWLRVGYCQGNFNSDNCAAGGFTLDYGPFGFMEVFDPAYQSWTGGGRHFAFFNQPKAAEENFKTFCGTLRPLLVNFEKEQADLDKILIEFEKIMQGKLELMWAKKLGFKKFDSSIFESLIFLMIETKVDFNMFFRELSKVPKEVDALKKSFYTELNPELEIKWKNWLQTWTIILKDGHGNDLVSASQAMKEVNPKFSWREWFIVPAYEEAMKGNYSKLKELQKLLLSPYEEQSQIEEEKYYLKRPKELFNRGGVTHYSCSS